MTFLKEVAEKHNCGGSRKFNDFIYMNQVGLFEMTTPGRTSEDGRSLLCSDVAVSNIETEQRFGGE